MSDADLGDRSSAFSSESVPDAYERYLAPTLFEPWAELLLETAVVAAGAHVLDVASGTGVVARAAARRAGPDGVVVASDVSKAMLTRSAAHGALDNAATIGFREAPADALPFESGSFDVVLCQQGLQFFPAQQAAVDEMRRVVRSDGVVGVSVWARGHPLVPFGVYFEELLAIGAGSPFPRAFEPDSYTMSVDSVRSLFEAGGFSEVDARVVELEVSWPDSASVAAGVMGTPFGPVLQEMADDQRRRLQAALMDRFQSDAPGGPVRRQTAAVVVRAVA